MESKLNNIVEAFKHLEYEQAARQIDQLERKREKAKSKLSEEQEHVLTAVKCGCMIRLGRYGEAAAIIKDITFDKVTALDMIPIYMDSARDLGMPDKQQQLLSLQQKFKEKLPKEERGNPILKNLILMRKFGAGARICLQTYTKTSQVNDGFQQIYLEFLEVLARDNLLMGKRDTLLKTKSDLKMPLIDMFWTKLLKQFPMEKLTNQNHPVAEDMVIFSIRLAITLKQMPKAFEELERYRKFISDPIVVADLYRSAYFIEKNEVSLRHTLNYYEEVFRSNMDIVNYRPLYDLYRDYLQILKEVTKESSLTISQVPRQNRYDTTKSEDKLSTYLSSLVSDYQQVSKLKPQVRLDYHSTCMKTLLLQILQIMTTHQKRTHYLKEYVRLFGKTLTFCEEFENVCPEGMELPSTVEGYSVENNCIMDVNRRKLEYGWGRRPYPQTQQHLRQLYAEYTELYHKTLEQIDKNRVLEKGERYLADQYIIILADLFLQWVEHNTDSLSDPLVNLIVLLESCSKKSQFNYTIKLKLICIYQRLCLSERSLSLFETLDIKSVQFQTLGYLVYEGLSLWGMEREFQDLLVRALKSYQDNAREIKEYAFKCLERNKLYNLEQFLSYDDFTERSYSRLILFIIFANKMQWGANVEYFLRRVMEVLRSSKKLTFSCDYKRLRSSVSRNRQYCSFFGVLNSRQLVINDCALRIQQIELMNGRPDTKSPELKPVDFKDIIDFSQFECLRDPYNYKSVGSSEQKALLKSYECLKLIHSFQTVINSLCRPILYKQDIASCQKPLSDASDLLKQLSKFQSSPRQIMLIQKKLPYSLALISNCLGNLSGKKKKNDEQKKLGQALRKLKDDIYGVVCGAKEVEMPKVKLWNEKLEEYLKELQQRVDSLSRRVRVTNKQYDSLYKLE